MSHTVATGFNQQSNNMIPTYSGQQNHNNNQSLGAIEANFDLGGGITLPP